MAMRAQVIVALLVAGCTPAASPSTMAGPATTSSLTCRRADLNAALARRVELQLAPEMEPVQGAAVCGELEEGERLRAHFQVAPDGCYAVLAHTLADVEAIELLLWAEVPDGTDSVLRLVADTVLAQDDGLVATIGAGEDCYRFDLVPGWSEPVPVVAEVEVLAGAGPVAVAPYEHR